MEINKIKIDKSADYPKSFYKKLNAEQTQYKGKTGTNPKAENNCLIEEVDCESSIMSLAYTEPKYKYQGKPVRKSIKASDKQQSKKADTEKKAGEYKGTERKNIPNRDSQNRDSQNKDFRIKSVGNASWVSDPQGIGEVEEKTGNILKSSRFEMEMGPEDEKCVIEEVDCKLSLINIGYDETQEEEEEIINDSDIEAGWEEVIAGQAEETEEEEENLAELRDISESITGTPEEDQNEYDINRYASTSIVDTIVIYAEDKEDVEEIAEETGIYPDTDRNPSGERKITGKAVKTLKNRLISPKVRYAVKEVKEKERLIIEGVSKNLLHSEAIHIKNKLGFLSLLAFFGLLGIFTENRACLGFWAFLYYVRYFYVVPDKLLKENVQKAAAYGFFSGIVISLVTVVLEALFQDVLLLIFGMGFSMVVSILVFTLVLAVYQVGKSPGDKSDIQGQVITKEALCAELKPYCEQQVKAGNMTQQEADEMLSKYK